MSFRTLIFSAAAIVASVSSGAQAATLDQVRARAQLVCGVNTGLAGFSLLDSQGIWKGLDVDYCRAIAAATLGDPQGHSVLITKYQGPVADRS